MSRDSRQYEDTDNLLVPDGGGYLSVHVGLGNRINLIPSDGFSRSPTHDIGILEAILI